ncbi:MAG TPA: hypothetical protein VLK65_31090 [Vicinamibacteria bacterium]|nr:hypothetical protein [Vicinamibacteria bacterium]
MNIETLLPRLTELFGAQVIRILAVLVLFVGWLIARMATLLSGFLTFAGQLALGIIVFGVGLFLVNLASQTIRASRGHQAGILATAARIGILVLSTAVALREMGIANEIIEIAFGLMLGSVAVAAAIAFGLGGREVAAKQAEAWRESLR